MVSSLVSCSVGASLIAVPVLECWNLFQTPAQDYDGAIVDLRQAITVIDFSELGGKRAAMPKIDWSNYDGSTLVVNYDSRVKKWQKHEISPCPNNMPIGYSLTGDCALSGVV